MTGKSRFLTRRCREMGAKRGEALLWSRRASTVPVLGGII